LKKNDLTSKTINELNRNQSVYFFISALIIGFIFANLTNQSQANSSENNISKTVMAHLISSGFEITPEETLIEETAIPNNVLKANQEKYSDNSNVLKKELTVATDENADQNSLPIFSDDNDLIFKPIIINNKDNASPDQNNQNNSTPQRTVITNYTVQNGDTISAIARRFGLSVNTILWTNNLTDHSLIQPGDNLIILPYSGILYTAKSGDTVAGLASQYGVDINQIFNANNLTAGLKIGQKIIIPGARPKSTVVATTRSAVNNNYTGLSAIRDLIKAPTVRVSGSTMTWPTVGYRITQYFSWRHTGVDIANKIGTPIYAADDGVVTISQGGYNGGYGNTIVIDHGSGKKTRYGHASKLFVKVGDIVKKGENIAAMGSTGRSTGPHLHFEVLINGVRYNPLNYIH
jgi:murein DD-endopeptidase MepM/ murein hydrolase activator NlpD